MVVASAWIERLVASDEPAARWVALTQVAGVGEDDPGAVATRRQVLDDPRTADLLARLEPWEEENPISGHDAPRFAPNLLGLLFDIGVRPADDPRIGACLDAMLRRVDAAGRFQSLGSYKGRAAWSSLPCDHHAILDVLVRAGRAADPVVREGIAALARSLADTPQGRAWCCVPDPAVGFRGPGRKADVCPQATLEAMRVVSLLDPRDRPRGVAAAARTPLEVWRRRDGEKPYMFGHGRSFKEGKWPATWYSALAVVETVGRFPEVWTGPDAEADDTRAMAELGACVAAYVLDRDGRVAPRSVYRGFAEQSFGTRGRPSDLAAALVLRALARLQPIAAEVAAVDVRGLAGSKGGSGRPRPPRTG